MSEFLVFDNVSHRFGDFTAVDKASFSIEKGEIFSLLGPSGCGKTTLLKLAAGFLMPDEGRILLNGKDISTLPPEKRPLNTVFQNYALFPHLSVKKNIGFGPTLSGKAKADITADVEKMLALVHLEDHADKMPNQLSGGQKQRVAIARALINNPEVLLLDEPLAALDLKMRQRLLVELDTLHDEVGTTFIYVTHDQSEAMGISDRIAVMNHGEIEQIGKPTEIYEAPVNSFVAAFIGDTNFLHGEVSELIDAEYSIAKITSPEMTIRLFNDRTLALGDRVTLSLRPEKLSVARNKPASNPETNFVQGQIEDLIYLGSMSRIWVRVGESLIMAECQHRRHLLDETPLTWEENVWVSWNSDDGYLLENFEADDKQMLSLPN